MFLQDEACTLKMLQRLRQGGIINIHMDAPFALQTVELPFLGAIQKFPISFIRFARIAGAPLIPFWFNGNRHSLEIEFEPALEYGQAGPEQVVKDLVGRLEAKIRARPEQYELWIML